MAPIVPNPRLQPGPAKIVRLVLQVLAALLMSLLVGVAAASLQDAPHVVACVTGSPDEVVSHWILEDSEIRQLRDRLKTTA